MVDWTPKPKPKPKPKVPLEKLTLTGEEGYVLSRVDGATSVGSLIHVTGMPESKVRSILANLVEQGAVEPDHDALRSHTTDVFQRPDFSDATIEESDLPAAMRETADAKQHNMLASSDPETPRVGAHDDGASLTRRDLKQPTAPADIDLGPARELDDDAAIEEALRADLLAEQQARERAERGDDLLDDERDEGAPPPEGEETEQAPVAQGPDEQHEPAAEPPLDVVDEEASDTPETSVEDERNYRKLFETELHELPADQREELARTTSGARLLALCFDPTPGVVRAVFENSEAGLAHARLVARHHRNPVGLDALTRHAMLLRDPQVQRELLRNPMLHEALEKRLLQPRRMADVYRVTLDRDVPDKNRQRARTMMRSKFSTAPAEERADLIFRSEGRVLQQLTGLPFDSQTTQLLCARTYNSVLLIQNLARFGPTPPQLIVHLLRQGLVKRQAQLKNMLFQHPNCPGDAKRRMS
jgi:hypothetical protein